MSGIVTVEHAYALLCDEGYAESRERSGYIVIFRPADGFAGAVSAAPALPAHSSASTYPSFSVSILSRTIRKVLADPHDILLERSPNAGLIELRDAIRQYLARKPQHSGGRGTDCRRLRCGNISIASSSICSAGTKSTPSNRPLTTSWGKSITQKAYLTQLPLVRDGIDSDALARSHADILHTTPYRSFPSGVTATASSVTNTSAGRKKRIVSSSNRTTAPNSPSPSQPMETLFALSHQDRVIYLNTFSKTISPSMRAGYMVLPRRLVTPFSAKAGLYSCSVPTFEQLVLTELLNSGDFERHINRERRARRKSSEQLCAALAAHSFRSNLFLSASPSIKNVRKDGGSDMYQCKQEKDIFCP